MPAIHTIGVMRATQGRARCQTPARSVFGTFALTVVELHSRAVWFRTFLVVVSVGAVNAAPAKVPTGFVDLADVAPDIVVDMRYAGADNFLGRPARGYGAARLPAACG